MELNYQMGPLKGQPLKDMVGADTPPQRKTTSTVFYVVQGKGAITMGDQEFSWKKNDVIALPPWCKYELINDGAEDAILFSINDRPIIRAMKLYREEKL